MRKTLSLKFPNESYFIKSEINIDDLKIDNIFDEYVFAWYGDIYISLIKSELIIEDVLKNGN